MGSMGIINRNGGKNGSLKMLILVCACVVRA